MSLDQKTTRLCIPDIAPLITLFSQDPENIVGGNLHIYLSDGNVEDSYIKFCLEECVKNGDLLGEAICLLSLKMSITQRKKIGRGLF